MVLPCWKACLSWRLPSMALLSSFLFDDALHQSTQFTEYLLLGSGRLFPDVNLACCPNEMPAAVVI